MSITRATISHHGGVADGARNAKRAWTERTGILLELIDERGNAGRGEASPLPGYSIDSLEDVEQALRNVHGSALPPWPPHEEAADWLRAALEQIPPGLPSARCALEAALLELLSRRLDVPIAGIVGRRSHALPVAHIVRSMEQMGRLLRTGVRTVKVKIGKPGELESELAFLRALREMGGAGLKLRVDANRGLGGANLTDQLHALSDLSPEMVEEPAPYEHLRELGPVPVPLAIDETLFEHPAPASLIASGRYAFVVLKPMALGGILHCLDLAAHARSAGAKAVVTHMFDGPIGWCVAATLACAAQDSDTAAGLGAHGGLDVWPPHRIAGLDPTTCTSFDGIGWGVEWIAS